MKINKREKKLIMILVIIVFVIGFYRFVVNPLQYKSIETRSQLEIKEMEYNSAITNADSKESLTKEYEALIEELEGYMYGYFTHIEEEQIILLINEISSISNIQINTMEFNPANVINIDETIFEGVTVSLNISGGYLEISEFVELIELFPKRIVISSLSMYNHSNSLISSIDLEFYSISKIVNEKKNIYTIDKDINNTYDPFN